MHTLNLVSVEELKPEFAKILERLEQLEAKINPRSEKPISDEEAAKRLEVSSRTVTRMKSDGRLRCTRKGGNLVVRECDVEDYLLRRK